MCVIPECDADPCIYDEEVKEAMTEILVADQVANGYFD